MMCLFIPQPLLVLIAPTHGGTTRLCRTGADSAPKWFTGSEMVIRRQLRTQYVEGICDNPVTLKSKLTVTQDHWK